LIVLAFKLLQDLNMHRSLEIRSRFKASLVEREREREIMFMLLQSFILAVVLALSHRR
jgi:hypothetical protein